MVEYLEQGHIKLDARPRYTLFPGYSSAKQIR